MENSKISWTDATHNEWIGCTKWSPGCLNCYAENLMDTRYGRVKWGKGQARSLTSPANRRKPLAWNKTAGVSGQRLRVFSASLSDWLDQEVPAAWLTGLLTTIAKTPNLDWLLLTKRPELWETRIGDAAGSIVETPSSQAEDDPAWSGACLAADWLNQTPPPNVWVGTTVEDQKRADERVPALLNIPAKIRFLSCEPLIGPVNVTKVAHIYDPTNPDLGDLPLTTIPGIDWIIVGGESGANARPMSLEWARALRDQAVAARVSFHFKQFGEHDETGQRVGKHVAGRLLDGREWNGVPGVVE